MISLEHAPPLVRQYPPRYTQLQRYTSITALYTHGSGIPLSLIAWSRTEETETFFKKKKYPYGSIIPL